MQSNKRSSTDGGDANELTSPISSSSSTAATVTATPLAAASTDPPPSAKRLKLAFNEEDLNAFIQNDESNDSNPLTLARMDSVRSDSTITHGTCGNASYRTSDSHASDQPLGKLNTLGRGTAPLARPPPSSINFCRGKNKLRRRSASDI